MTVYSELFIEYVSNRVWTKDLRGKQFEINQTYQELAIIFDNNVSFLAGITSAEIKYSPLSFVTSG